MAPHQHQRQKGKTMSYQDPERWRCRCGLCDADEARWWAPAQLRGRAVPYCQLYESHIENIIKNTRGWGSLKRAQAVRWAMEQELTRRESEVPSGLREAASILEELGF